MAKDVSLNGIALDGVFYQAVQTMTSNCNDCDLKDICDFYFSNPTDAQPCQLFTPDVEFRISADLTNKLQNDNSN